MASCKITAATMAAIVALAVVLLAFTVEAGGATCGSPSSTPDICGGGSDDACRTQCISEKYDKGACYGDPKVLRICVCERPC